MGPFLALGSSLMWGSADFLGGVTSRRTSPVAVYGLAQAVGLVALAVAATVAGAWSAAPGYWPWAIASSVLGAVGMVAFYSALAIGPMGIVSPLVSMSVIVPVAFGLLSGEAPGGLAILGILIALIGVVLASGPELSGAESPRALVLAGLSALAFGGMYITMAEGSSYDPLMTMTAMRITSVIIFAVVLAAVRSLGGATRRDALPIIGIGMLDAGANVMFGVATTMGLLATISMLGSLYPVVTAVLAAIFLAERLRAVQYAGVACAMAGIVLISAAT